MFGCPKEDVVDCDSGILASNSSVTCADACEGECCVGTTGSPDACEGFTGRVCKDNYSCNGEYACTDADIDLVVGGCSNAYACQGADIKKGVLRGCIDTFSCYKTGGYRDGFGPGGYVGFIKDGCVGNLACRYLGGLEGYVGFVDNGCVGEDSCERAGIGLKNAPRRGGRVGFIRNACKGERVCQGAGSDDGFVGFIENSCTGKLSMTTRRSVCVCIHFTLDFSPKSMFH